MVRVPFPAAAALTTYWVTREGDQAVETALTVVTPS